MNKEGKTNWLIPVLVLSLVGLAVFYGVNYMGGVTESVVSVDKCGDSTGILTVSPRSSLIGGTDPSSPTITCGINGGPITTSVTSGTTTFAVGSKLECLVSKADYIDKSFEFTMPCGGKTLDAPLYYATSDNPAITIKDTDSNTITDAIGGGASNISNVAKGGSAKFDVYFEGTNGEGTGEGVYVIEFPAGSSANITDVSMGNLREVAVPTVYSSQNAGSKVVAFAVPNIQGAVEPSYRVIVTLGSGKDLIGGIYTDAFWGQEFIDDDKTISAGVEDSDGTAKYENTADYDIYVNAA